MTDKIKIGIVEDDVLIAHVLQLELEEYDFEIVWTCHTFQEAKDAIALQNFDVLLLDINLGEGDNKTGITLAQQFPNSSKFPFIFLTAYSDKTLVQQAALTGPSAYLVKPASGASLFAAIQTAFYNHAHQHNASLPNEQKILSTTFYSKIGSKLVETPWDDVYAIVAMKNYVQLQTPSMKSGLLIRSSLANALQHIVPAHVVELFTQISRSTLLRKTAIDSITSNIATTPYGSFETTRITE